jgi:hypothetical protein
MLFLFRSVNLTGHIAFPTLPAVGVSFDVRTGTASSTATVLGLFLSVAPDSTTLFPKGGRGKKGV